MEEAVTQYTCRAAEKLRRQAGVCSTLQVFLQTNAFRTDLPQYHPIVTVKLITPTSDPMRMTTAALTGLRAIYKAKYRYVKAGVMLNDLQPKAIQPLSLFEAQSRITGPKP